MFIQGLRGNGKCICRFGVLGYAWSSLSFSFLLLFLIFLYNFLVSFIFMTFTAHGSCPFHRGSFLLSIFLLFSFFLLGRVGWGSRGALVFRKYQI